MENMAGGMWNSEGVFKMLFPLFLFIIFDVCTYEGG